MTARDTKNHQHCDCRGHHAALDEIRRHDYALRPGRCVGAAEVEDDGEPFEQEMKRLTATLEEQFAESVRLEKAIRRDPKLIGYAS